MAITPDTNIKLLKVPIEISNKNQITFANATDQFNYFNSLPKLEIDHANYQRKDNVLDWPAHIDIIMEYNYCMYQNENYSNKWFYAFIINMQYENNGCTKITLATDVFQTWQFDLEWKQSFIEREMLSVADDVPGANLIPEGLELGEMKINATATIEDLKPAYVVVYSGDTLKTPDPESPDISVGQNGYQYNGIYSYVEKHFPNLAENDLKLFCLLCTNLSPQIIKLCLNLTSARTVTNYRSLLIKKKMGLNMSFDSFLQKYINGGFFSNSNNV